MATRPGRSGPRNRPAPNVTDGGSRAVAAGEQAGGVWMSRLGFWWVEVRRRRVLRVALWYLAGAWVLAQVTDLLFDAFDLAGYTRFVIAALVAGLPVALVLAWVFDITPRGIERTLALRPPDDAGDALGVAPAAAPENSIAVLP